MPGVTEVVYLINVKNESNILIQKADNGNTIVILYE